MTIVETIDNCAVRHGSLAVTARNGARGFRAATARERSVFAILLALWCVAHLCAQTAIPGGVISGVVRNSQFQPEPLAQVSISGAHGEVRREALADASGRYRVAGLTAGDYELTATSGPSGAAGAANVTLREGQGAEVSITLGASRVGGAGLPLPARGALELARLRAEIESGQPGGNIEGWGVYGTRGNSAFNSYGQRSQNNNLQLDGIDNNDPWVRGEMIPVPLEASGAVALAAGYIPAELGHVTGAAARIETRSGADEFHGSAFEYWRGSRLAARSYFDAGKPGLLRNQFGAAAGGAIRPGKWYFFGESEGVRGREGATVTSTVPTRDQKAGQFSGVIYDPLSIHNVAPQRYERTPLAGNRVPTLRISQAARALLALYPDPTQAGLANNYSFASDDVRNGEQLHLRTDYSFDSRGSLFARVSYGRLDGRAPGALPAPAGTKLPKGSYAGSDAAQNAGGENTESRWLGAAVSHTWTASANLVNELRAGYARNSLHAYAADRGLNAAQALGIPGLGSNGLPYVGVLGYASLGAAGPSPFDIRSANYEIGDAVNWRTARHAFRFGIQAFLRHVDGDASEWSSRGEFFFTPDYTSQPGIAFTGDALASLLFGFPSEARRDVQLQPYRLRGREWAAFAQDSFRLGRLTVEAGLRYSLLPPVAEASNRMVNFNFQNGSPALDQFAGTAGVDRYAGVGYNKRAISPRVGFSFPWTPNLILRGAFSQAYDTGPYIATGRMARNAPYASRYDSVNGTFQVGPSLTAGIPAVGAAQDRSTNPVYAVQPVSYTPYSDQWMLAIERRLRQGIEIELRGMGSMGMHLHAEHDANQPYPAPTPYEWTRYPFEPLHARVEYLSFAGGSTYYGGLARVAAHTRAGFWLDAGYTFSKALDDATAPGSYQLSRPALPQYVYHLRGVRSVSPYDTAQRFTATAHYDLPFRRLAALKNWRVDATATLQTGFPFTPELAINSLNNGGILLPDRVGDGSLPSGQRTVERWFNTSLNPSDPAHAFQMPLLYVYGNSGFNVVRGPGLAVVDAALSRSFRVRESGRLETRVEFFNLLNRANFALPDRILGLPTSGSINHTAAPGRRAQAAIRLEW